MCSLPGVDLIGSGFSALAPMRASTSAAVSVKVPRGPLGLDTKLPVMVKYRPDEYISASFFLRPDSSCLPRPMMWNPVRLGLRSMYAFSRMAASMIGDAHGNNSPEIGSKQ